MVSSMTDSNQPAASDPSTGARWPLWLAALVIVVLGLAALWSLAGLGPRSSDTMTQTFQEPVERVVVEVNGTVSIEAGSTTEVTLEREWLLFGEPTAELVLEDGVLRVTSECGLFGFGCQSHVTATVPAESAADVTTSAGNVTVTAIHGGLDLTTSAGNVAVEDVTGPASLRTSAGGISGDVTDGDVEATTSAGTIDMTVLGDFSSLSAVTSAGSVRLTVPDDVFRVEADTSAGSITTNLATDPDADRVIVARSSAGNVTIDRISE